MPVGWVPSAMAGSESGDGDDGPTINDELRATGQIPDDKDDMGDAAHLLFGRSAPPTNRDDGADGGAPAASAAAGASAAAPSDDDGADVFVICELVNCENEFDTCPEL